MPDSAEERLVLRAVAALVAFVFAAGVAVALLRAEEEQSVDDVPTVDGEPLYSGTGPLPGTHVPTYVAARDDALGRVKGRVTAVLSFREYRTERQARERLAGLEVVGLLVASPGSVPVVATDGLDRWAARQRTEAETELTNLRTMLETTEDPDFRAEFEADIARLSGVVEYLDPRGDVVFGAVVVADASVLGGRSDVRLVDVVEEGDVDDPTVVVGLRPEETGRAGDPRTRPLP